MHDRAPGRLVRVLEDVESDDPASTVDVGDVVTYTVVITQVGEGAVLAATLSDDLSGVFDDATYRNDVLATNNNGGDPGTASIDEGTATLSWSGNLDVDEVVTITYSVTVTGAGDEYLLNEVTTTDTRGVCGCR